jgi:cytochrome c oxidase subunit 2
MFAVSAFVILWIALLIVVGLVLPRRRRTDPDPDRPPRWSRNLVVGGGVVFPLVILTTLWVLTLRDMAALSAPRAAAVRIDVTGYQWWWKVAYPNGAVTANDIHIPTGQRVLITLRAGDVIHSFWVPQLQAKMDLIPGRVNRMWLEADRPGIYRGQCAEYCGLQHANMIFYVVAQTPAAYQAWLARESQGVAPPATADLLRGQEAFLTQPCVACHTIRGTPANGTVGPDLTHFGSRLSIGAGTVPNTPGNLAGWIVDSQGLKPGNKMPPIELPAQDLQDLVQYLESLK